MRTATRCGIQRWEGGNKVGLCDFGHDVRGRCEIGEFDTSVETCNSDRFASVELTIVVQVQIDLEAR